MLKRIIGIGLQLLKLSNLETIAILQCKEINFNSFKNKMMDKLIS